MPVEYGLFRPSTDHAIAITANDSGVMAMSSVQGGKRVTTAFFLVVSDAPAALPSTSKIRTGLAFDSNDALYVTQTEPTTKLYSYGIATRLDGTVWVSSSFTGAPKEVFHPTLGFVLVSQTGALFISGFAGIGLADLGAGAVDTSIFGFGSATFTRATAGAARLSTGLWKLDVASGVARAHYYEYTVGTMTYGGYLDEPAATQLAVAPRDMTNAAWVSVNVTPLQNGTGIDGAANSCTRLTSGAIGGSVQQTVVAAASTRTYSAFIKRVTGTGTITINQGATTLDVTASINSTTFTLVQLPASVLNSAFGITFGTSGDVILVDCNQFEAGGIATTPIPAAGSRNADVLLYTFAGNADATQGTCYAEIATNWAAAPANFVVVGFNAAAESPLRGNSADAATVIRIGDGTNALAKTGLSSTATGVRKRASSWGAAGLALTGDGLAPTTMSFDGNMGSAGIGIGVEGDGAGGNLSGTIKNVKIWTFQRNDLASITA